MIVWLKRKEAMMNDLQRTTEWYLARQGKVTASMIYLLLQSHKEPMTEEELAAYKAANPKSRATQKDAPFSQSTFTYLHGKVMEWAMNADSYYNLCLDNEGGGKALQWGTDCEELARSAYEKATGYEVVDAPFIPYAAAPLYAGGSPDGIIKDAAAIVEFKCPFTLANHFTHLQYETAADLKDSNPQYYAQCQMNMMVYENYAGGKCEWCDFVSYDPRVKASLQLKVLRIYPDESYQARIAERITIAAEYIKHKYSHINKINKLWK